MQSRTEAVVGMKNGGEIFSKVGADGNGPDNSAACGWGRNGTLTYTCAVEPGCKLL